jgi:DNA-binding CsgD family transcriptional regulator
MLEQFGFTEVDEAVYFALVDVPELTATELAARVQTDAGEVPGSLGRLKSAGLVSQRDGCPPRYSAIDLDVALAPLIAIHSWQLERARIAARLLSQKFRAARPGRDPLDFIEVVVGARASSESLSHLVHLAQSEIRGIDKRPYLDGEDQGRVLTPRDVRVRKIYDRVARDAPGLLDRILDVHSDLEEQARIISESPFHLRLADDRLAIIFLNGTDVPASAGALILHPSPVLDGVVRLFETLWRYAIPLRGGQRGADRLTARPTAEETLILQLMAAGMTDEAAARHLGMSLRTVQRHVRAMMDRLGVKTRFQAGLRARDRGWL